jgi:hypothetical protein
VKLTVGKGEPGLEGREVRCRKWRGKLEEKGYVKGNEKEKGNLKAIFQHRAGTAHHRK